MGNGPVGANGGLVAKRGMGGLASLGKLFPDPWGQLPPSGLGNRACWSCHLLKELRLSSPVPDFSFHESPRAN